jgi:Fe-S cluster assembly ATP-binding protein
MLKGSDGMHCNMDHCSCRSEENCLMLITHYKRLLEYIKPDIVHVMADGNIVRSGGFEIVEALEKGGFATVSS